MESVEHAAIVTGSATGIGAAVAKNLAARGYGVVINYTRSEAEAKETKAACVHAGGQAVLCRGDVSRDEVCQRLARAALDSFGRIDVLVNNAGVTKFVATADLEGLSKADFEYIFGVNVVGAFQMTRAAAPALKSSGRGCIVNLSSYSGMSGLGSSIAYAASKGALNTLTRGLAHALAPEIRVNAICPGYVDTRWGRRGVKDEATYENFKNKLESNLPLKTIPIAEDVAETVLWFIDGGRSITGETVIIDGGKHLVGDVSISDH